ncbi:3-phosphoshikimate 1-carboxyvinyltransferase [Catenovulum sp. 2E275]|uniref:3-phosphoshikimate 1-carboxyvinyltransferase n=1 Tax=Catenovulum sp. 2E275 TaxID=2980497 RepID=UPI0021CE921E|nr:3-phosphoshikimate 1-carboxyvinyltransferase [Catenovulum sp. 2E275]MCU4674811.1 3-phosphoshikimate 1-carboxyvinyltransferase [Catenovulum sp. 2E275]
MKADEQADKDPAIEQLLNKMPKNVANSFTQEQLNYLTLALSARKWGRHKIDLRRTLSLPFSSRQFYFVFLFGKNSRTLSRTEKNISALSAVLCISLSLILLSVIGLLILYLAKSALGIDIFSGFSLGIWHDLKGYYDE